MDELIETIADPAMKPFMHEARACYHAQAYRGCVVLSCLALFADIREKIRALAAFNAQAATLSTEVERRVQAQDVFESYMLDQLGSTGLIDKLDQQRATRIRDLRNKSAHPSGHAPSASEARFVFEEVIDLSLSKSAFLSKASIDLLVMRLHAGLIYVSRVSKDVDLVTNGILSSVASPSTPYLYTRIGDTLALGDPTDSVSDFLISTIRAASRYPDKTGFIKVSLVKAISNHVLDPSFNRVVLVAISSIASLPMLLGQVDRAQAKQLFIDKMQRVGDSPAERKGIFEVMEHWELIDQGHDADVISAMESLCVRMANHKHAAQFAVAHQVFLGAWIAKFISLARSSQFDTANSAAQLTCELDQVLSQGLSAASAAGLLSAIASAGQGTAYYARTSRAISDGKFSTTPQLRAKVRIAVSAGDSTIDSAIDSGLTLNGTGPRGQSFVAEYLV